MSGQPVEENRQTRQYVESADTKLLAETLGRRLGLSSQQLAQVVPQLGVALGAEQGRQRHSDGQQQRQPVGGQQQHQQPVGSQQSTGMQPPGAQQSMR
ncbi:hypothetical protein [Halobacterium jilantaiense]|nr:hypothetical protein [Halobacterium jilantaiense]